MVSMVTVFPPGTPACSPASLDGGTYGLKLDGNGTDNNGNLNTGNTYAVVTVKCLSTGFVSKLNLIKHFQLLFSPIIR